MRDLVNILEAMAPREPGPGWLLAEKQRETAERRRRKGSDDDDE